MSKDGAEFAAIFGQLEPLKISFAELDEERGYYCLLTSGMPFRATQDGKYVTSKSQCDLLAKRGISFDMQALQEIK
jgi:hypothetical protein